MPTTTRRRLTLPPPYPPINIAETVDEARGRVRYRFRGTRAHGTILIGPEHRGTDEAIPTNIYVQFGDDAARTHERPDPPIIYGVPLTSGVILSPADYLARTDTTLYLHRPTSAYSSTRVPDATNRYGSAIVHALITAWYTRPDRDQLIRTAAHRVAQSRLHELHRTKIDPARARIEKLEVELLDHLRHATELYQPAREHEATQPEETPAP